MNQRGGILVALVTLGVPLGAPVLAQNVPRGYRLRYVPDQVLVRTRPGLSPQELHTIEQLVQGDLEYAYHLVPDLYLSHTGLHPRLAVSSLRGNPLVAYAHRNWLLVPASRPDEQFFDNQWGLHTEGLALPMGGITPKDDEDIDAPEAWEVHTGTGAMTIAILDTGVAVDHPDLVDRLWKDPLGAVGRSFVKGGMVDPVGHGTFVAGILGAAANETGIVGVLQDCELMPLRFMEATTKGVSGDMGSLIEALEYAVDQGVRVSNNSYGAAFTKYDDVSALVDAIGLAGRQGHLFVTAAGNDGVDLDDEDVCYYPAQLAARFGLDNMLVVTSIDLDGSLPGNASYGPGVVDIAAPGQKIFSTNPLGWGFDSGTSYATAFVTGVAALVWDLHPDASYRQIKTCLLESVRPVSSLADVCASGGVVNAAKAIRMDLTEMGVSGLPGRERPLLAVAR